MEIRFLFLFCILGVLIGILIWSTSNYFSHYSDDESSIGKDIDLYGYPMILSIIFISIIVGLILYFVVRSTKWRYVFAPPACVGTFFILGVLVLTLFRNYV